jgi:YD repeat-containing protein
VWRVTNLVEKWRTTTAYGGDRTMVTPPSGGTPTTTVTDMEGRTVELLQHHSGTHTTTSYKYDRKGKLEKVVDTLGNEWSYKYDRGRGDVAGPSDVWQEGVAVLEAAALEQIERAYGRDPVTKYWQPSVRSSLEGKVTFGSDWWTSAQFSEKAEQASGMSGSYYFESTSRAVIFKLKKSSTAN